MKILHHGEVRDCKLMLRVVDKWRGALMRLDGKKVVVTLEEDKDIRSIQQNRFYRVYLELIENDTGTPANDLHEIFKRKFLPARFVKFKDEEIKLPATTTKLEKDEFGQYMDKICALTNIPIPNPDELA